MLSDSESENSGAESTHRLTINEHYAKAFQYKKEREELSKLKEKYGSDAEESDAETETDSEEGVTEDEDGEELTPAVDAAILRTLARIKRKDPEIYDAQKAVFEEEQKRMAATKKASTRAQKDKSKPVTIRQAALASALNPTSRSPSPEPLPHVEEQRALRDETIAAFHHAVDGEEEEEDGLLVPREKTKDEQEREEEEYRAFLEREVGAELQGLVTIEQDGSGVLQDESEVGDRESKKTKKKRKEKGAKEKDKGKSKQETDQEFLMNYILNRGWIDRSARHIPTYREVTGKGKDTLQDGQSESGGDSDRDDPNGEGDIDLDDDEEFEEINDVFESSYNFRFEEPDAAVIKSYPRSLPSLVRREDTTRKDARARRKERKEEELLKKREEVKRLKALKMCDVRAKLERIGREGGKDVDQSKALQDLDLEGDWDPDAHDQQMAGLYGADDDGGDAEMPQWDDDIDIGDIVAPSDNEGEAGTSKKSKKKKKKKSKDAEEGEGEGVDIDAMDAEVERDEEEWDGTEEMRKRKLDEYMDEIYGLDFNDVVGDLPTRFKYATVQPQSYALTPAEILTATDAELNQYLSVKKYAPYRKEAKWDHSRGERLKELKTKVGERLGDDADAVTKRPAKKRKGKKERMRLKTGEVGAESGDVVDSTTEKGSKRKREDDEIEKEAGEVAVEDVGSGKKRRRRHKKAAGATV